MTCERKHRKLKHEEKRPPGVCGGEMVAVDAASNERSYGFICASCGAGIATCEACGKNFVDLERHMFDSAGNPRPCFANAPMYRTARAVRDIGKLAS